MTKIKKILNNLNSTNKLVCKIDRMRNKYANKNNETSFLNTYSKKYDIENLNTGEYWNEMFSNNESLIDQSPMTKDKISIIANCIPRRPGNILDLGIGLAFLEEQLKKRKDQNRLFGLDISPHAIELVKRRYPGKYITGDVLKIKTYYSRSFFDTIIAIELLEHIDPSKVLGFYEDIKFCLKDSGRFILSIPINEHLDRMSTNPSAHVRDYTYQIINKELEISGFEIEKSFFLSAFDKYYRIKKLLAKFVRNRWEANSLIVIAKKSRPPTKPRR